MDWKNGKGFVELKMERRQNNRIISDDEEGKREHICIFAQCVEGNNSLLFILLFHKKSFDVALIFILRFILVYFAFFFFVYVPYMLFLTVTVQVCERTAASSSSTWQSEGSLYRCLCTSTAWQQNHQWKGHFSNWLATHSVDVLLALWPLNIKHLLQLMFNFLLNRWLFQVNDTSWDFIIHKQSWSTYSWDDITVLPYFTEICVFLLLRVFGDQMYNIKNWFKNIPSQALWESQNLFDRQQQF